MCIAVPVRVTDIERNALGIAIARVDVGGAASTVRLDYVPDAEIGDYVMAHMGFALQKVDEAEAEETLAVLRRVEEASPPRTGG